MQNILETLSVERIFDTDLDLTVADLVTREPTDAELRELARPARRRPRRPR